MPASVSATPEAAPLTMGSMAVTASKVAGPTMISPVARTARGAPTDSAETGGVPSTAAEEARTASAWPSASMLKNRIQ